MSTLIGIVKNIRVLPTQTKRHIITFVIGEDQCKAFDDAAREIQKHEGQEVMAHGDQSTYQGKREMAVREVNMRDLQYHNAAKKAFGFSISPPNDVNEGIMLAQCFPTQEGFRAITAGTVDARDYTDAEREFVAYVKRLGPNRTPTELNETRRLREAVSESRQLLAELAELVTRMNQPNYTPTADEEARYKYLHKANQTFLQNIERKRAG